MEKRLGCGKSSMFQIRGIGAIKRHRFFALHGIDGKWEALVMKDVEPPLRPVLEAPDDTSNFDKYLTDYTMYTIQDISTIDIAQSAEDAEQA